MFFAFHLRQQKDQAEIKERERQETEGLPPPTPPLTLARVMWLGLGAVRMTYIWNLSPSRKTNLRRSGKKKTYTSAQINSDSLQYIFC